MDKNSINSNIVRAVEDVVDKFLANISPNVDPATMDIIYRKYHALGVLLIQDAYVLSRDTVRTRPWLPVSLVESICRTINNVSAPKSYS